MDCCRFKREYFGELANSLAVFQGMVKDIDSYEMEIDQTGGPGAFQTRVDTLRDDPQLATNNVLSYIYNVLTHRELGAEDGPIAQLMEAFQLQIDGTVDTCVFFLCDVCTKIRELLALLPYSFEPDDTVVQNALSQMQSPLPSDDPFFKMCTAIATSGAALSKILSTVAERTKNQCQP
jgi:hypothetical protein